MNKLKSATVVAMLSTVVLASVAMAADAFSGKVVAVLDGDTIDVMHEGKAERLRLNAIDCPEKKQAFGMEAKQCTSSLCFGKVVSVTAKNKDRYGRTIADVSLADGTIVNTELVSRGMAWWYRKYAPNRDDLAKLEERARTEKMGLWQDAHPIAPWDFRHSGRKVAPVVARPDENSFAPDRAQPLR